MSLPRPRGTALDTVPEMAWQDFLPFFAYRWEQGEHVTFIGPTKSGKTTLARELLELRRTVVGLATKPKDDILPTFRERGYRVARKLPLPPWEVYPMVLFWPKAERLEDIPKQKEPIRRMLSDVFRQGGDTVYIDELWHVSEYLKLKPIVDVFWRLGRTQNITFVTGTQRPAFIPRVAYSQSPHLFIWQTSDTVDVRSMAGMAGQNRWEIARIVRDLPYHSFLYVNAHTRERVISRVELGDVTIETSAPPVG